MNVNVPSQTPQLFGSFCQCPFVLPQKTRFYRNALLLGVFRMKELLSKLIRFHNKKIPNSDTGLGSPQTTLWCGPILFLGNWKETGSGHL